MRDSLDVMVALVRHTLDTYSFLNYPTSFFYRPLYCIIIIPYFIKMCASPRVDKAPIIAPAVSIASAM